MTDQVPKFALKDLVSFYDDPEVGTVTQVLSRRDRILYRVKFSETVDQIWPGFVYPEHTLVPAKRLVSSSEADLEDNPQPGSEA